MRTLSILFVLALGFVSTACVATVNGGGGYELLVGASSRDIRASAVVEWDGR